MYNAGFAQMTAFDYSFEGIKRAYNQFGAARSYIEIINSDDIDIDNPTTNKDNLVRLIHADFTNLSAYVHITFDKGTLDAIYITGKEVFAASVQELTRITKPGGIVMCISNVITQKKWIDAFCNNNNNHSWDVINNGDLAFASDGAASINLI